MHKNDNTRWTGWSRFLALAIVCLLAGTLHAQSLELSYWTVDGGGGTSTGGTLTLRGTIAQPDADQPALGGTLELTGGFWPCAVRMVGDVNGDVHCDVTDLLTLVYSFGLYRGNPGYNLECDFNYDDAVDVSDLLALVYAFGTY
jgi:hypothetical protein